LLGGAIEVSLKKLDLGAPHRGFVRNHMARDNFDLLPIMDEHLDEVVAMPFHHKDPFDRLLVAQAMVEAIPTVSADAHLSAYAIQRIW
jgi:PIN domain nuclease of toxin-antitoxin system